MYVYEINGQEIETDAELTDAQIDEIAKELSGGATAAPTPPEVSTPSPAAPEAPTASSDAPADPEAALVAPEIKQVAETPRVTPEPQKERTGSWIENLFADFKDANKMANQIQENSPLFSNLDRFQSGVAKSMAAPFVGGAQLAGEGLNLAGANLDTQSMVKAADAALGDSSGVAGSAGQVVGSVINPLYRAIGSRLGLKAATTGQALAKGVATGATSAALNPVQSEEYWATKGLEMAAGGAVGGALGAAFGKQVVNSRQMVDKAFKDSSNLIDAAKDVQFRPVVATKTAQDIGKSVSGAVEGGLKHPDLGTVRTALKNFRIKAANSNGSIMAYEELKRDAAKIINNPKAPAAAKKAAYALRNTVDDLFSTVDDRAVLAGSKEGIKTLIQGREVSRAAHRANIIQEVMDKAQIQAAAKGGTSYPKALQAELQKLAAKPNKVLLKNFSPEEVAELRKLSKGNGYDSLERMLGTLSGHWGALAAVGGAPITAGGSLAVPVAAAVGRKGAEKLGGSVREAGLQGMISNILAP